MKKQYLEEWKPHQFAGEEFQKWRELQRVALACAAPAMVRVLISLEGQGYYCPECGEDKGHHRGCELDAALTAAGLPDQESRQKLREMIQERSKR